MNTHARQYKSDVELAEMFLSIFRMHAVAPDGFQPRIIRLAAPDREACNWAVADTRNRHAFGEQAWDTRVEVQTERFLQALYNLPESTE